MRNLWAPVMTAALLVVSVSGAAGQDDPPSRQPIPSAGCGTSSVESGLHPGEALLIAGIEQSFPPEGDIPRRFSFETRLFQIAAENGKSGEYIALMQKIQTQAEAKSGKMLPINATGAIGAICCEFGFPWKIVRGFGVMARAIGLVGHILEESENPISYDIWQRVEEEILETSGPGA